MLVISLTVVDYFSKRVFNDVIKSEVSTGIGIFFWSLKRESKSNYIAFIYLLPLIIAFIIKQAIELVRNPAVSK